MEKPLDTPACFWPISFPQCASKFFERIILPRLLFFLKSNSILFPRKAGFHHGRFTLDQLLFLYQSILNGINITKPGSRMVLATIDFPKFSTLCGTPPIFTNLFQLDFLLALPVRFNLSFVIRCLRGSSKSQKLHLLRPSRCFARIRSWPCTFLFSHQ